ncbi:MULTISPECIES: hypothetical protein [unclassified Duganella]|uniref:hypothetical protein n=1 Tax=unclassified Duganella TaxID=2636909 RepID=UPI000888DB8C|nr:MULTISPECIES: hypothetical protein [unclassified Duganella]SDH14655.1 hypothetical protein SAMN05216320_11064 [Duganella sp. OV458]SDK29200.1 hypothetical protein SAMN05428973_11064 [Duganella sp. OV510]
MRTLIFFTAALLLTAGAAAQNAPSVTVAATRDPVDKSYRKMLAGMDIFERHHALAPHASLRFQLLPRLPTTQLDGITLRVAGDSVSLPVKVAPDHTFTLERNAQAAREDAALIASRKTSTLTWRAQVRSPNVPEGMRRLGDLRLECMVGVEAGLLSNNAQMFAWLGELFTSPARVCGLADGNYLFFADRPVYAVTLRDGKRRATLPMSALYAGGTQTPATLPYCDCQVLLDRSYYAPIWDRSWSDDTLLAFDDMDSPPGPDDSPVADDYRTTARMQARLGPAKVVSFDSGYQMWRYTYPASGDAPPAEFTILFGPDGVARKARLQEPVKTP